MTGMPFEDFENVYERLADAIDRAGPDNEALFLAKLVLLLAQHHGDAAIVAESVETALRDLPDRSLGSPDQPSNFRTT